MSVISKLRRSTRIQLKTEERWRKLNKKFGFRMDINDGQCSICLDILIKPIFLPCGHEFCHNCLLIHFRVNNRNCPLCRTDLRSVCSIRNLKSMISVDHWNYIQHYYKNEITNTLYSKKIKYKQKSNKNLHFYFLFGLISMIVLSIILYYYFFDFNYFLRFSTI